MFDAEKVDGATLHVVGPHGRDDGHAVALVNSLGCDLRIWDDVANRLSPRARVFRYDKRGHGLSSLGADPEGGDGSIERHAADLAALIERRLGGKAVVCGLSIGGLIAMALALARPDLVSALVLCDTAPRIGSPERYAARAERVRAGGLKVVADEQMTRWFGASFRTERPLAVELMREMLSRQSIDGYLASVEGLRRADLRGRADKLAVPTLCLSGAEDCSTPPGELRALAEALPHGVHREIAGAGHLPPVERPEATAEAIAAFLDTLPAPARTPPARARIA